MHSKGVTLRLKRKQSIASRSGSSCQATKKAATAVNVIKAHSPRRWDIAGFESCQNQFEGIFSLRCYKINTRLAIERQSEIYTKHCVHVIRCTLESHCVIFYSESNYFLSLNQTTLWLRFQHLLTAPWGSTPGNILMHSLFLHVSLPFRHTHKCAFNAIFWPSAN